MLCFVGWISKFLNFLKGSEDIDIDYWLSIIDFYYLNLREICFWNDLSKINLTYIDLRKDDNKTQGQLKPYSTSKKIIREIKLN